MPDIAANDVREGERLNGVSSLVSYWVTKRGQTKRTRTADAAAWLTVTVTVYKCRAVP
jgi:hypothetical protein